MFYKKGNEWVVSKGKEEVCRCDTKEEAALQHYTHVRPELLDDYKAGKLTHKPK